MGGVNDTSERRREDVLGIISESGMLTNVCGSKTSSVRLWIFNRAKEGKKKVHTSSPSELWKLNLKSGSATHSASGDRQFFSGPRPPAPGEVEAQRGVCLLYAMLMLQPYPIPVEVEKDSQVGKIRSTVPSRSAQGG